MRKACTELFDWIGSSNSRNLPGTGRCIAHLPLLAAACALIVAATPARALVINPVFDTSISGNSNAAAIEGSIGTAIDTIDGLYANPLTISVNFSYNATGSGNLLSTSQAVYITSYGQYVSALGADSTANPQNNVLATAVAHLSQGNNASGTANMVLTGAQFAMLGLGAADFSDATININSTQNFAFAGTASSSQYDLTGGLEHELDEVLGGGGGGSWLNYIKANCPGGLYCNLDGALDLYRYSADGTPSFTTSPAASSYLSIDGGATSIVGFNQNSGGDYGDFAPPGAGPGQLIQDAFNPAGQDEPYTTNSPEFVMEEAIGWDPVPEPSTLALLLPAAFGMIALLRRRPASAR